MTALRALLAGIVDYAGLFPPAALDMATAVRNYAAYRADDDAWMLGRFVVPIARLEELVRARDALRMSDQPEWRLSGIAGADVERDLTQARDFNRAQVGRSSIDSIEARLATPDAIRAAAAGAARGERPFALFTEVPLEPDPGPLVAAIAAAGVAAKIRTGGVTADAIPPAAAVVRGLRRCIDAGVCFKATAGLHHPLCAEHPLTYDVDAPVGVMYGYLNIFLAAAFMHAGMADADAVQLLGERSAATIVVTPSAISWREFRLGAADIGRIRSDVAVSFGSCSFREPVDELRMLAISPDMK